ncbi:GNAT family N-acetyltransferase [Sutcliffiella halmapala]|uniref:GNAT family N-acetyltransferase n=1 Tax=Sutcliffiella halmapala TaxID=79882 RepID=UPI000994C675|nr:GNAT family N-acetyltransferase [Sutcliffiella halmapala]
MIIRLAKPGDAPSIAKVHVDSWKTTYKGLIADSYLEELSYENRARMWAAAIERGFEKSCIFVAEVDGEIVGFANGGMERTQKYGIDGELFAIYLLQSYQKKGIGKKLCTTVAEFLHNKNYQSMLVWVLANNPSRAFYHSLHPEEIGVEQIQIGDQSFQEIAYAWKNLKSLLHQKMESKNE